jgi:hypothetical protein
LGESDRADRPYSNSKQKPLSRPRRASILRRSD